MKKLRVFSLFTAVLLLCAVLTSCNSAPKSADLCLPGLEWGQPMDDALAALDTNREALGEENVSIDEEYGGGYAILEGREAFGQESVSTILRFGGLDAGDTQLAQIIVYYPDDADMEQVLSEMKSTFGEPVEQVAVHFAFNDSISTNESTSDDANQYWAGPSLKDTLDESKQQEMREAYGASLSDEDWETFLTSPVTTAQWSTDYQSAETITPEQAEAAGIPYYHNAVVLNANHVVSINYLESQTSE